eukprot:Sspe_Gene.18154::Locus_6504_Transcript_1_1_Confidence_1.000_Length_4724::g.18154::m.18154
MATKSARDSPLGYVPSDPPKSPFQLPHKSLTQRLHQIKSTSPPLPSRSQYSSTLPIVPQRAAMVKTGGSSVRKLRKTVAPIGSRGVQHQVSKVALQCLLSSKGAMMAGVAVTPGFEEAHAKVDLLELIKKRTIGCESTFLDLSSCGILDTHVVVLAHILSTHPTLTHVDLTDNFLTDHSARLLLDVLRRNRNITVLELEGGEVSDGCLLEIHSQCQKNERYKRRREQRRVKREMHREAARWQAAWEECLQRVLKDEAENRRILRTERREALSDMRRAMAHVLRETQAKLNRAALRRHKREERQALGKEEEEERRELDHDEMEARRVLQGVEEAMWRQQVIAEQNEERAVIKKEENQDWILSRRSEKARLKREETERSELECEEEATRREVLSVIEAELAAFREDEASSYASHKKQEQERIDFEEAERWKQKQEQIRLENERQWKKEREMRDAQRREAERQREREREYRAEQAKRLQIEKEEERHREMLVEMRSIDLNVARAYALYGQSERARTAAYRVTPQVTLSASIDPDMVHFTGENPPAAVLSTCDLELSMGEGWKEVEKSAIEAKRQLKMEVNDACKTLRERGRELLPLLLPHMAETPAGTTPVVLRPTAVIAATRIANLKSRNTADRERENQLLREIDVELSDGKRAALWYNYTSLVPVQPPVADEALEIKEIIQGGVMEVKLSSYSDSLPITPDDRFFLDVGHSDAELEEVAPHHIRVVLGKGIPLSDVVSLLRNTRYKHLSSEPVHALRHVEVSLTLQFPALGERSVGPKGYICTEHPFTSVADVTLSHEGIIQIAPGLLSLPPSSKLVVYEEDTPSDKCALYPDIEVTNPPLIGSNANGTRIIRPCIDTIERTFMGGMLKVQITENYCFDDQIVLRHYYDDDLVVRKDPSGETELVFIDRSITPNPPQVVVATLEDGVLMTHKDADDRGDLKGSGIGVSDHFTLRFCSSTCNAAMVTKILRRLRFVNYSQNPSALRRTVVATLEATKGQATTVVLSLDVISEDDPTQLILSFNKCTYRPQGSASVPESQRKHLRPSLISIFESIKLDDPDTEYIQGGEVRVTAQGKGAAVFVQRNMITAKDKTLYYLDTPLGTLLEGGTTIAQASPTLRVELVRDGSACLTGVQQLLRAVVFTNLHYQPSEASNTVELLVTLGPNVEQDVYGNTIPCTGEYADEDCQLLSDKVEVKIASELFEVTGGHTQLEYREGSGAVRLAPFEVHQDHVAGVESYGGGWILVEIAEGRTDDDIINLRGSTAVSNKEGELTIILKQRSAGNQPSLIDELFDREVMFEPTEDNVEEEAEQEAEMSPTLSMILRTQAMTMDDMTRKESICASVVSSTCTTPRSKRTSVVLIEPPEAKTRENLKDRVREKLQRAISQKRQRRESMLEQARRGIGELMRKGIDERTGKGETTVSDVTSGSKRIGTLVITPEKLLVKFSPGVNRKDVLTVLRNVTYSNRSNDPDVLSKVIRITLRDAGTVATQAIVQVAVQPVDDVTEVYLSDPRPKYRPGMKRTQQLGCWPLAGLRRACLVDPDTEYFDGGYLGVEI